MKFLTESFDFNYSELFDEQIMDNVKEAEEVVKDLVYSLGDSACRKMSVELEYWWEDEDYDDSDDFEDSEIGYGCEDMIQLLRDCGELSEIRTIDNILGSSYCPFTRSELYFRHGFESYYIDDKKEQLEGIEEEYGKDSDEYKDEVKEYEHDLKYLNLHKEQYLKSFNEKAQKLKSENTPKDSSREKTVTFQQVLNCAEKIANSYDGGYLVRGYITTKGYMFENEYIGQSLKPSEQIRHGDAEKVFIKTLADKLECSEEAILLAVGILTKHDAVGGHGSLIGDKLNWIRVNSGFEKYIALPEKPLSTDQKYVLQDWIRDFIDSRNKYLNVSTHDGKQVKYVFGDNGYDSFVDEKYIMDKIMKYYSTGKLLECNPTISNINEKEEVTNTQINEEIIMINKLSNEFNSKENEMHEFSEKIKSAFDESLDYYNKLVDSNVSIFNTIKNKLNSVISSDNKIIDGKKFIEMISDLNSIEQIETDADGNEVYIFTKDLIINYSITIKVLSNHDVYELSMGIGDANSLTGDEVSMFIDCKNKANEYCAILIDELEHANFSM